MKILEITDLNKRYKNGKVALENINITINAGEFVALLGHNGAGKSTLIGILASLITKTSGTVKLKGYDLDQDSLNFKKTIGIVPQEVNFDPFFTPLETLRMQQKLYGIAHDEAYIQDILKQLDLTEQQHSHARTLSGGMKRRLLIAKTLIHKPEIIFLDEPTTGVDVELRIMIWDYFSRINKLGTTIVLTTHYLEEAEKLCNRIIILDSGKLIIDMPKQELLSKVGNNKLHIEFADKQSAIMAQGIVKDSTVDGNKLIITSADNNDIITILTTLRDNNLKVVHFETTKPQLQEVFLNKTAQ